MNRENFLDIVESKEPVDRNLIGEVSDLVDIFPWFQSAHLLLLKALKNNEDIRFDSQLRHSSIYIGDREQLYYYLGDVAAPSVTEAASPSVTEPSSPAVTEAASPVSTESDSTAAFEVMAEPEKEPAVNIGQDNAEDEVVPGGHPILIQGDVETEEAPGIMLIQEDLSTGTEDEMTFLDSDYSSSGDDDLLELVQGEEFKEEEIIEPAAETQQKTRKEQQLELIDRFITTNPRIEPQREKSDLPLEDLSSPGAESEGTFVTDTLARIYTQQGYYSKAIEIYEKLSLKYPEKSSYFAAQIEKVKEYLKK